VATGVIARLPWLAKWSGRMIQIKTPHEIELMRASGLVTAGAIKAVKAAVAPGVSTGELDAVAEDYIRSQGGVPTFKGYRGYPAATCLSPNDVVVHGIPNGYALREGDILSVDVGVTLGGFVADSAWTFPVGEIAPEAQRLLDVCQAALAAGIPAISGTGVGA